MKNKIEVPERVVRMSAGDPTIDVAKRTIECTPMTRCLASDGGIIIPDGIVTRVFEANPVVLAMHAMSAGMSAKPPVVGRCLAFSTNKRGMVATTQFADTELGREYAYLYGVNEKKEVYMRAWSFGWTTTQMDFVSVDEARALLGTDWDEETVPPVVRKYGEVWIARKSVMNEYSPVPIGSDKKALSRAAGEGIRTAWELIAGIDLKEAQAAIDELRNETNQKFEKLERDMLALRRDGAAAAARGDTAAFTNAIRIMAGSFKEQKQSEKK